jgi:hypothetical protein
MACTLHVGLNIRFSHIQKLVTPGFLLSKRYAVTGCMDSQSMPDVFPFAGSRMIWTTGARVGPVLHAHHLEVGQRSHHFTKDVSAHIGRPKGVGAKSKHGTCTGKQDSSNCSNGTSRRAAGKYHVAKRIRIHKRIQNYTHLFPVQSTHHGTEETPIRDSLDQDSQQGTWREPA